MPIPVYNYDPTTLVFRGEATADENPLDPANPLVPAFATTVPAPAMPEGSVAVFNTESGGWTVVDLDLPDEPAGTPAPAPAPAPEVSLELLKAGAQASLDSYFEQLYLLAVPNAAIANEYVSAYQSAKDWLDGGATGTAPVRVTAMAESMSAEGGSPVTEVAAAEFVVLKWLEAEAVLDQRGAARLRAKAAVRAATTAEEVQAAEAAGRAAMAAIGYTI